VRILASSLAIWREMFLCKSKEKHVANLQRAGLLSAENVALQTRGEDSAAANANCSFVL
jgi:hypothetical protein